MSLNKLFSIQIQISCAQYSTIKFFDYNFNFYFDNFSFAFLESFIFCIESYNMYSFDKILGVMVIILNKYSNT
jgi:hypothetical protein